MSDMEMDALQAYLNLLKTKGASNRELSLRKHFLRHLISELAGRPRNGDTYRLAFDRVQAQFPDNEDTRIFPLCAREFYFFWIQDLRQIALMNSTGALDPSPVLIAVEGTLVDMLLKMDEAGWEMNEIPAVARYVAELEAKGVDLAVIDIRERLIRLVLFSMRDQAPSSKVYRAAVDAIASLFAKEDARQLFIQVAREFFYYWNDSSTAEVAIQEE